MTDTPEPQANEGAQEAAVLPEKLLLGPTEVASRIEVQTGKWLLRPAEVARLTSISRSRCYELIAEGRIPAVRLGKSVRVSTRQLEEFIRHLETEHAVVRQHREEDGR